MSYKIPSSSNLYYGPPSKEIKPGEKPKRDEYNYHFNETISLSDTIVFQTNVEVLTRAMSKNFDKLNSSLQTRVKLIEENSKILKKEMKGNTKANILKAAIELTISEDKSLNNTILAMDKKNKKEWLDPELRVEKYESSVKEHIERRVDHFLLQLATCMGTGFHFEVGKTQNQAISSPPLNIEYDEKSYKLCKRNSAHGSTFPCLKAYEAKSWEKYVLKKGTEPKSIDFLKWSRIYNDMNSTISMPISVNNADLYIDAWHHDSEFSIKALEILNLASKNKISMFSGMRRFLKALKSEISSNLGTVKDAGVLKALSIFQDELNDADMDFSKDLEYWVFKTLLGTFNIQLEPKTLDQKKAMLKLVSVATQRHMRAQSELITKSKL